MKKVNFYTLLLCLMAFCQTAFSQATLSIQGIIQKSNGAAVEDGNYDLTFKLYPVSSGGTAVHTTDNDLDDFLQTIPGFFRRHSRTH